MCWIGRMFRAGRCASWLKRHDLREGDEHHMLNKSGQKVSLVLATGLNLKKKKD